jgi:hypothetical protein
MIRGTLHLPHRGPRVILSFRTLFFALQLGQDMIWNSSTGFSFVELSSCSLRDFTYCIYVSSFSSSSMPIPFLIDRGTLTVLFTMPLIEDMLPSGMTSLISRMLSGANPLFVLIKRPVSERLLVIQTKLSPSAMNLASSLLVNRGRFLLFIRRGV